jgi:FkbM family methyltransferase
MLYGVFEIKTVQLMRSLLKQGDTVIDVGANVGWFSLLTAKIVGPSGKVHAFEPLPQNQRRLQANMDKNGLKNISLHPVGAGEADGEFEFYSFENDMLASLRPVMEGGTKIKCQVRTLDQELRDVQSCKVFKIDIEGAGDRARPEFWSDTAVRKAIESKYISLDIIHVRHSSLCHGRGSCFDFAWEKPICAVHSETTYGPFYDF